MDGNAQSADDHERSNAARRHPPRLLEQHWPSDKAKAFARRAGGGRPPVACPCRAGPARVLGADPASGGPARDPRGGWAELGRAACPAPMLDAAIVNTLLAEAGRGQTPAVARLLGALHAGEAYACVSFGAFDPGPCLSAASPVADGARVRARWPLSTPRRRPPIFVIFDAGGPSVGDRRRRTAKEKGSGLTPTRAMGMDGLCKGWRFAEAPAVIVPVGGGARWRSPVAVAPVLRRARPGVRPTGRFELVVQYVKIRQQFGQPVGRFQGDPGTSWPNKPDRPDGRAGPASTTPRRTTIAAIGEWRTFAAASFAYCQCVRLRQVALETHHSFGRHRLCRGPRGAAAFSSASISIWFATVAGRASAREELADRYLGEAKKDLAGVRPRRRGQCVSGSEVRAWLAEHWSPPRPCPPTRRTQKTHIARHEPQFGGADLGKDRLAGI